MEKQRKQIRVNGIIQERLEDLKEERKLNQKEMAEAVGVQESLMSSWLNGEKAPGSESLIKISKGLNVSVDYLLGLIPRNVNTTNIKSRYISKQTGLSMKSLQNLNNMWGADKMLLNELLSSPAFFWKWLHRLNDVIAKLASARNCLETLHYDPESLDSVQEAMRSVEESFRNFRLSLFDLSEESSAMVNTLFSTREMISALDQKERELSRQYNALYNSQFSGLSEESLKEIID